MSKLIHRIHQAEDNTNMITDAPSDRIALLLAGGDGTRLQELTREIAGIPIPKQYCRLLHESSLLENTLLRAQLFTSPERITVVVNENHLGLANEQLKDLPESNIFVQPLNRDTGPGLVFSLLKLEQTYPGAIVAVFPTDHYVDNNRAFIAHALHAVNVISQLPDKIAILGIAPDRPETAYGYIIPAEPLENFERIYHVKAFTEKPSLNSARKIISHGGFWNTSVMVFKLSRMMELLCNLVPNEFKRMLALQESPDKAAELYQALCPWNLSTQVLARIPQHLIMLELANVHWSDWGTRESIERTYRLLNRVPFWNLAPSARPPKLENPDRMERLANS